MLSFDKYCKLRSAELTVFFGHTRPSGVRTPNGENCATGIGDEKLLPEGIFNEYLNSEGHRLGMIMTDYCYSSSSTFIKYEWNGTSFEKGAAFNATCFWSSDN